MHYALAVLRRAAAERRMTGSEHARDAAIEQFLGELQMLFTPRLIEALDHPLLAQLYEDWLRALPETDQAQRLQALIQDVHLSPVAFLVYRTQGAPHAPEAPGDNVIPLHAR